MSTIKITWQGHACFTLERDETILVLDPYDGSMIGYPDLSVKAHAMLASHEHGDHNFKSAVLFQKSDRNILQETEKFPKKPAPGTFYWRVVETDHDDVGGSKRGQNKVHVICADALTLVHLGDLGHVLNAQQVQAIGSVDVLFIPVGGKFTIDAQQAWTVIEQVKPKTVIPMHYNPGFSTLPVDDISQFLKMKDPDFSIEQMDSNTISLDAAPDHRILVFRYEEARHPWR